jgi:hypothetical protein
MVVLAAALAAPSAAHAATSGWNFVGTVARYWDCSIKSTAEFTSSGNVRAIAETRTMRNGVYSAIDRHDIHIHVYGRFSTLWPWAIVDESPTMSYRNEEYVYLSMSTSEHYKYTFVRTYATFTEGSYKTAGYVDSPVIVR